MSRHAPTLLVLTLAAGVLYGRFFVPLALEPDLREIELQELHDEQERIASRQEEGRRYMKTYFQPTPPFPLREPTAMEAAYLAASPAPGPGPGDTVPLGSLPRFGLLFCGRQ